MLEFNNKNVPKIKRLLKSELFNSFSDVYPLSSIQNMALNIPKNLFKNEKLIMRVSLYDNTDTKFNDCIQIITVVMLNNKFFLDTVSERLMSKNDHFKSRFVFTDSQKIKIKDYLFNTFFYTPPQHFNKYFN